MGFDWDLGWGLTGQTEEFTGPAEKRQDEQQPRQDQACQASHVPRCCSEQRRCCASAGPLQRLDIQAGRLARERPPANGAVRCGRMMERCSGSVVG